MRRRNMLGSTTLTEGDFVAVDIETTGCRPGSSGIIEIGAVLVRAGLIQDHFQTLVRPSEPIPHSIRTLTGIDDDMVAGAPDVDRVMREFRDFVGNAVLVAHNHRFDMGFLDFEAERAWGRPFPRPVLDTLALARRLHPELDRHNLRVLATFYAVDAVPNHRAPADALATAQILQRMLPELDAHGLHTAEDVSRFCGLARQGILASKLVLATHLPDAPGVYLFRNECGDVVYIGRAKNLRMRVRGFFYGPSELERAHPAAEAAEVQHVRCASDLDAMLIESRLVARYHPRFNKDQQRGRALVYLRVDDRAKFPSLTAVRRRPSTGLVIGPLTNIWAAETLARALRQRFGLRRCARRITGDTLPPCDERDLGACPRPCVGAIGPVEYRQRVDAALSVFDDGGPRLRAALQALRERAAMELRYEEAILHRDAVRALDRTMSGLEVVRNAASEPGVAIVEGRDHEVVVHLIRYGRPAHTLRGTREDVATGEFERRLARAVRHAYSTSRLASDPYAVTLRELREIFIVETYRRQHAPAEIPLTQHPDDLVASVMAHVRLRNRVPRKMHGVPSVS
ncbi:MAG: exonuclease domain-containing protein [Coriobacteriia bacterium]